MKTVTTMKITSQKQFDNVAQDAEVLIQIRTSTDLRKHIAGGIAFHLANVELKINGCYAVMHKGKSTLFYV